MCLGTVGRARGAARQNAGRLVRALSEKKVFVTMQGEARPAGERSRAQGAGAPAAGRRGQRRASWAAQPAASRSVPPS